MKGRLEEQFLVNDPQNHIYDAFRRVKSDVTHVSLF